MRNNNLHWPARSWWLQICKKATVGESSKPFAAGASVGALVRRADGSYQVYLQISNPSAPQDVKAFMAKIISNYKLAAAFLRDAGILHARTGRLAKRFGG